MTKPTAVSRAHAHWIRASWIAGLFIVALAGWTLYLIQMDATVFNDPEASEMQKWTTWVGVPLAGLLLVLLSQWGLTAFATSRGEAKAEARQSAEQRNVTSLAGQDPRHYVLEVIGLGVSLDKHRQGRLWDALQKGSPFTTIREMDPEKYPYSATDKLGNEGAADASALENGIRGLPGSARPTIIAMTANAFAEDRARCTATRGWPLSPSLPPSVSLAASLP